MDLWSSFASVIISWVVVCGHVLGGSVVIFWACGSFPGSWAVVMSWVDLWSSAGSVVISWLVGCGHLLGGSVFILWVCGHFLDRGLWSCRGWSVVIFWVCGHSLDRGLLRVWSCLGWACRHLLGLVNIWIVVCSNSRNHAFSRGEKRCLSKSRVS